MYRIFGVFCLLGVVQIIGGVSYARTNMHPFDSLLILKAILYRTHDVAVSREVEGNTRMTVFVFGIVSKPSMYRSMKASNVRSIVFFPSTPRRPCVLNADTESGK